MSGEEGRSRWSGIALGLGVALLGLGAEPGHAAHGGPGLPVIVESERLSSGSAGGGQETCAVSGVVQNPNAETVTARLIWRASDAAGNTLGFAGARVPRLAPRERRAFTSSPFVDPGRGPVARPCASLPHIDRVEAAADVSP